MLSICNSCEKEEPQESNPTETAFFSSLEVKVIECDDIACANPTFPSGVKITLFQTEDDAIEYFGQINDGTSDTEGKIFFSNLAAYDGVYVRVDYEDQVYISYNSLGVDITAYHEAYFLQGYSYDYDDSLLRNQNHISLSIPLEGQQSTYQYYFNEDSNFDIPELDTVSLVVTIVDKITNNLFLVTEKISAQPEEKFTLFPEETMMNYWEFTQDSLIVTAYDGFQTINSSLFGYGYFGSNYGQRFSVPLNPELEHKINFDDYDYYFDVNYKYNMYMEDVDFYNASYDLLYMNVVSLQAADGNLQLVIYNIEDGFVRYTAFDAWSNHGFNWLLVTE